jgi:dimethylamine monooxygenase subunit A
MTAKLKTPYDGSARLFQIGLKPLDPAEWIDVDDKLPEYLREKERLAAAVPDEVFAASAGTEAAQAEVLTLLAEHLPARFPEIYRRHGSDMEIVPGGRRVALDSGSQRRWCRRTSSSCGAARPAGALPPPR